MGNKQRILMFAILNLKSNLLPLLRNSEIFDLRTKLQNFPKFQYILTEHECDRRQLEWIFEPQYFVSHKKKLVELNTGHLVIEI